ncbi:GPW/gp25 family protein [Lutimonas halocynthiae]|uniref:GPW/gp25 family protein n=1 Tax=Lutimonas halocynthiae TaxID=1446477 RepID=UPI0025B47B94|nr:GPW/gp25 family protein [Lutimonas halocynthiae]MDN3643357.1 GPW/gp25 family protein [Lutimonas halocynthiae]
MKKNNKNNKSFLGKGWSFPPTFEYDGSMGIKMVENEQDIKESLAILFSTNLGERVMLPEYGCDLQRYLFDTVSNSQNHFLRELIRTAILRYEPRIAVNEIRINTKDYLDGIIRVSVDYTIRAANTRFNLVFPYYKTEGTDLPQLYHNQISQDSIIEQS